MPEICNRLWLKLKKIDHAVGKINEKYERKRMINISYLIKRVLGEYDKTEADKIQLNISIFYTNLYKILNYTFMKKPIQNSSHKSKNRRSDCCVKDINNRSSFSMLFPKSFKSMMEYQVIFQYR